MIKNEGINAEITTYKTMINKSISNKFYNAENYTGQTCDLHITLDSNGKLTSIIVDQGNSTLCQAAIMATKNANIPKPPNQQIYELFKNITLKFSP